MIRRLLLCALTLGTLALPVRAAPPGEARLTVVFVLDGLRPDAITPEDTPTLWQLARDGVRFLDGHAVWPTVTRANAAAIGTGMYPGANGVPGNSMYVAAVDPNHAFGNDDHTKLLKLDAATGGRMVLVKTLGERFAEAGKRLAAVSSGSTGSALLLNPRAPRGVGVLVNGYLEPGRRVAWPDEVSDAILAHFGAAPARGGAAEPDDAAVAWTERVLREHVLPELKPDVVINWLTEPDHIQHALGAGSPEAKRSIAADDRELGLVLEAASQLGLTDALNVIVVSDHGFERTGALVNVTQELIGAGLKAGPDSDDVVLASSGQTVLVHVKGRERAVIERVVRFLQAQAWTGVIFTAGGGDRIDGTFGLELVHLANPERGPDIAFTFAWSSAPNAYGVPGTTASATTSGASGPVDGQASNHGSMSPWSVRNTFLAWGRDFKRGVVSRVPVSNVDLAPTLLALAGIEPREPLDGRVLREAMVGGPDLEQVPVVTHTLLVETPDGRYRAALQVSEVAHQRYIDKSWRLGP
jgi:predicted AlkP superfamily pyrophosphatase or phosphodiesterase